LVEVLMKSIQPLSLAKQLIVAGLTIGVINGLIGLPSKLGGEWLSNSAVAQSGGRARGGSFDPPSSGSQQAPSGGGYSGGGGYGGGFGGGYSSPYDYSVPYDYSYPSRPDYYPGSYRRPRVIVVPPQSYPVPVDPGYGAGYGSGYGTSSSGDGLFLILVFMLGACMLPVLMSYMRASRGSSRGSGAGELANDVVTVTQVQVALLAQARQIQDDLTQMSVQANLDSQAGLAEFLRETVLALLRSPENWSHARVSSQTVRSRQEAAQLFEQLSIQERSKLDSETLVNVGGQIRRQAVQVNKEADPASYIVVTLLVGTADDRPLVSNSVHSAEELTAVLKRLGGISPAYLMIYEVIWSPQDASDSLSRDQLLTHYPDLVQIA
jgi:uncharacterized membrane protein